MDENTFWEEIRKFIEKQKLLYGSYWRLFCLLYSITSYQISRYNIIQYQIKSTVESYNVIFSRIEWSHGISIALYSIMVCWFIRYNGVVTLCIALSIELSRTIQRSRCPVVWHVPWHRTVSTDTDTDMAWHGKKHDIDRSQEEGRREDRRNEGRNGSFILHQNRRKRKRKEGKGIGCLSFGSTWLSE